MKLEWHRAWGEAYRFPDRRALETYICHGSDDAPLNLEEFIKWLTNKLESIPEAYRQYAEVRLSNEADPFEIKIVRPESDAEYSLRMEIEASSRESAKKKAEEDERQTYERLKRKFG